MLDPGFENNPILVDDLPDVSVQPFQPIEPKYIRVLRISNTLFMLIILIIFCAIVISQIGMGHWVFYTGISLWFVMFILMLLFTKVSVRNKSFAIRTHDISFKKGVFFKEWTTISFNRVQHCEITKGVIDNLVGLVELKVFTAGGSSSDLAIPGLKPDLAARLKEHIMNKVEYHDEEE